MLNNLSMIRLAIQKSGRLHEKSLSLLRDCGIDVQNGRDKLKVEVSNFPIEILYLRNSDIPQYIEDGVADIGIIGENLVYEKSDNLEIIKRLGFSKCRVSLAIPKEASVDSLSYFNSKKIATSYPNTLRRFLSENNITADIHHISGSVEIAPNIGLADGICDIVSTGNTLYQNGLREYEVILQSEAVLVKAPTLESYKADILEAFLFRIQAILNAKNKKYVLMNVPNVKIQDVSEILPVLKSPTIMPLAKDGWSSLHSVINENKFWEVIGELKDAGAEDILIIPIDKMVA